MSAGRQTTPLDRRVLFLSLLSGAPAVALAVGLLVWHRHPPKVVVTAALAIVLTWLWASLRARGALVHHLRTLSSLVMALREGDYSIRGRRPAGGDALSEILAEVNALADELQTRRLTALEATALLQKVMEEIDVSVIAFDESRRHRWVNRAGERLLGRRGSRLVGETAAALGLSELLDGEPRRRVEPALPGGGGPWELRRSSFRQQGRSHELVVLADLRRALREEERLAWQRLVRVLGHEINNSLAPIHSIAMSLQGALADGADPETWREDASNGLKVIARRSEGLVRFLRAHAQLARLPPPAPAPVDVGALLRGVVALEKRLQVGLIEGPPLTIEADRVQLEQLLINLVRNAADAALELDGGVRVGWAEGRDHVEISVEDDGPGLPDSPNLFVPFFTTKAEGSGIGLVLSREIAEAHGGSLRLENAPDHRGSIARLTLPKRRDQGLTSPPSRAHAGV